MKTHDIIRLTFRNILCKICKFWFRVIISLPNTAYPDWEGSTPVLQHVLTSSAIWQQIRWSEAGRRPQFSYDHSLVDSFIDLQMWKTSFSRRLVRRGLRQTVQLSGNISRLLPRLVRTAVLAEYSTQLKTSSTISSIAVAGGQFFNISNFHWNN